MKHIILSALSFCFLQTCPAQTGKNESFLNLTDSTVKREIASFTIAGSHSFTKDRTSEFNLGKIPLKKCTVNTAYFEKGNWVSSDIIVHISSSNADSGAIAEVNFIHVEYILVLPDSAIAGLYEASLCSARVFRSTDKHRIYIYMLNGKNESQYEVTWIIQDSKYYGRVIDYLGKS
jgi:hypothetical protein